MSDQQTHSNLLGNEPVGKLLIRYGLPSIVSMLVTSIYNIVDQLYIAEGVGFIGNGATTVTFPIMTVSLALALLIGSGSAALLSLELGRGNRDCGKKIVGNAVFMLTILGLLMMVVTLAFQEPILRMLGATDAILPHAIGYSRYIAIGFPFSIVGIGLSNLIRADGSPRFSMFCNLSGAILNIVLDPIFIFTFDMGAAGAAIATAISQAVSCFVALYYIFCKANYIRLKPEGLRPDWSIVRRQTSLGSSSFLNQISFTIVNVVLNNALRHYGTATAQGADISIAAIGIIMKINAIFISIILGTCIGAQPILGYNYGAGNFARVKKTYLREIIVTTVISVVASILFLSVPEAFIYFFRDENPAFNEFAAKALRIFLCGVAAAGIQIPSANYFQAVGKPVKAMVLNMTRQIFILIPAILIMSALFGMEGILWAMPATDVLALVVTLFFIIPELRMLTRLSNDPFCPEAPK